MGPRSAWPLLDSQHVTARGAISCQVDRAILWQPMRAITILEQFAKKIIEVDQFEGLVH